MPPLSFDAQQALIQWLAFLLCVAIGYLLSRRASLPDTPLIWVLLAVAVFAFGFIPVLRTPIIIPRAPVPLGTLLWGVGIGAVLGLMINQAVKRKRQEEAEPQRPANGEDSGAEPESESKP